MIDVRDTVGTMGHAVEHILGRFLAQRTLVASRFTKKGPQHGDLAKIEIHRNPTGPWQYLQPVAMLINEFTVGPADELVCYMRSTGRAVTVGSTTHGAFSGDGVYAMLPCKLIVRISDGYLCDAQGTRMDGCGNLPDVPVAPTVADVLSGADPVLDQAVAALKKRMK